MKKLLLETSFSKIYILVMILITLLILGGYFSYAMFTVSKEKSNAISIVTGNLTYKLEVDGIEDNKLVVPANSSKDFVVTLSNPNNRIARFNFYYLGTIATGITAGYVIESGVNTPPVATGINMEASGTSGSTNTYLIRVTNTTSSEITINLGVSVGLDYNDLTLPTNGHLFIEYEGIELATLLKIDSNNNIDTTDSEQTFITGSDPNNYIWYSGKLWRAVSVDPVDNSVKLITNESISMIPYAYGSSAFSSSYVKEWLNDETVDGFLGNLREAEKFIKMDSTWNATMTSSTNKPAKTTMVTSPVGLLNLYELTMSYSGTTIEKGYLNINQYFYLLTPASSTAIYHFAGSIEVLSRDVAPAVHDTGAARFGIRPTINLKSGIKTLDGSGTESDPYRLEGDNDKDLSSTLLNTRYSGEYISFGNGENNLYRIVSHESSGLTKITSVEPLNKDGVYVTTSFGDTMYYSSTNTIGLFLNNDYLNPANGYLTSEQVAMIEDNTIWYIGGLNLSDNYKLTKYTSSTSNTLTTNTTNAKIGLLRVGELYSSPESTTYWTLTSYPPITNYLNRINVIRQFGYLGLQTFDEDSNVKPAFNLKENVIITSGDGTKENPFQIELG